MDGRTGKNSGATLAVLAKTSINLLCLPCAGASASMYLRWSRFLPHWIKIVPLEIPGRGTRLNETAVEDFDALVQTVISDYQEDMQQPFAFFGHSMGALLAYGISQVLVEKQLVLPKVLLLSACPSPDKFDPSRFPDTHDRDALIANLRQQGGSAKALFDYPELLDMTLNILAADYRLLQGFKYKKTPVLPILMQVLSGRSDIISPEDLLAWQQHSEKELTLHEFNGGHFYIQDQQSLVLKSITQSLMTYAGINESCLTDNPEVVLTQNFV
ncbi:MAG: surfactin synthase thioesterase subunit [Alteromonadaceae bacterium]|jgi:surfactin synthase thioesterase subunit